MCDSKWDSVNHLVEHFVHFFVYCSHPLILRLYWILNYFRVIHCRPVPLHSIRKKLLLEKFPSYAKALLLVLLLSCPNHRCPIHLEYHYDDPLLLMHPEQHLMHLELKQRRPMDYLDPVMSTDILNLALIYVKYLINTYIHITPIFVIPIIVAIITSWNRSIIAFMLERCHRSDAWCCCW